jgi:hypothetical protein
MVAVDVLDDSDVAMEEIDMTEGRRSVKLIVARAARWRVE